MGFYQEWEKGGSSETLDLPDQFNRWDTFVPKWLELSDKSMVFGDFNCIKNGNTPYQRRFDHIRDSVMDNFLLQGWAQLVHDETTPGLPDHVYVTDYTYIIRVYNHSRVDRDHNTIGVWL